MLGALLCAVALSLGGCSSPDTQVVSSDSEAAATESGTGEVADARGQTDTDVLAEMGIDLSGAVPVQPQSGSATGETTTAQLDAAALKGLSDPLSGMCIGTVLGSGEETRTIEVRVQSFTVLMGTSGNMQRLTLPEGTRVTLVLLPRPGAETQVPDEGRTIQADVSIEPASGDRPGRIVAVNFEVMGAQP